MLAKFKRINRGLVLGAIAIVVLIVYIIASIKAFKSGEKDNIENVIKNYAVDMAQCSVVSDEQLSSMTISEIAQSQSKKAQEVVNSYWMESEALRKYNNSTTANSYYQLKSDMLEDVSNLDYITISSTNYISSVSCDVAVSKIAQNGPNGATVTAKITYTIYGMGDTSYFAIDGAGDCWDTLTLDKPNKFVYDEQEFQLYKDDGKWRIVGIDMWNRYISGGGY